MLRTLAFVFLAIALAGPRTPDLHTRIDAEGVAIFMLVDVSGSMATHDFDWHGDAISRLDAVKRVFVVHRWRRPRRYAGRRKCASLCGTPHRLHRLGRVRHAATDGLPVDAEPFGAVASAGR